MTTPTMDPTDEHHWDRPHRPRQRVLKSILVFSVVVVFGVGVAIGIAVDNSSRLATPIVNTTTSGRDNSSSVPKPGRPVFLLLGDSITQYASDSSQAGWAVKLQEKYVRAADVINRGLSSYNTKAFIKTALPVVTKEIQTWLSPSIITLWLGANDAAAKDGRGSSAALPVDEYQANMVTIMKSLRASAPQAKLIVITPPTIDADTRRDVQEREGLSREPPDRTNEHTALYAAACRTAAKQVDGVTLLDMYGYLMDTYPNATQRRDYFVDGLHLNAAGNQLAFQLIDAKILKLLPGFSSSTQQLPNFQAAMTAE